MSMENVRKIEMKSGQGDDAEIKSVFGAKKSEGKVPTVRVFFVVIRLSMTVNGILLTICTFHFPATYLRFRFQLGGWQVIRKLIQKFILGPVAAPQLPPTFNLALLLASFRRFMSKGSQRIAPAAK